MKKILLVEDNAELQNLIRMTLDDEAYVIQLASDGEQALQRIKAIRPDLVVLDIMMPGPVDGIQVCEWVRGQPDLGHTRIIFVTARGQPADLELGRRTGADAYLVKPFSPLELIELTRSLLDGATRR